MLTCRPPHASDFAIISRFPSLAEELFYIAPFAEYPWDSQSFASSIKERLSNSVFLDHDTIVGFANFYDYEIGKQGFIGNVIVNPGVRRQGIGRQILISMIETGFIEHHFQEIHISCFSSNTAGLLLYRKLGFKPYGIEQRTDYKNEATALVNFSLNKATYRETLSGLKLNPITTKLADI